MKDTDTKKTSVKINDHTIRQLHEDNLNDWLMNIRAVLRPLKLWQYTQAPYKTTIASKNFKTVTSEEQAAYNDEKQAWIAKAEETTDIMTSTISPSIKKKLNDIHFNNSYFMLQRIKEKLQSSDDAQFMKLTQKYYSLDYDNFKNMSKFLDHVKLLEERIDATTIELTRDKRTLICLMMTLTKRIEYRSLIQIWNVTSDLKADKARAMLLEKYRQQEHIEEQEGNTSTARKSSLNANAISNAALAKRMEQAIKDKDKSRANSNNPECEECGKRHPEVCWKKYPDEKPEWMKLKEKFYKEKDKNRGTVKKIRSVSNASTSSSDSSSHPLARKY